MYARFDAEIAKTFLPFCCYRAKMCVPSSTNILYCLDWHFGIFFHLMLFVVAVVVADVAVSVNDEHCSILLYIHIYTSQVHKDTEAERTYFQPQWENLLHLYAVDNNACEPLAHTEYILPIWHCKRARAHRLFRVCYIINDRKYLFE